MSFDDPNTPAERTPQELAALLSDLAADTEEPAPRARSHWRPAAEQPPHIWNNPADPADGDTPRVPEPPVQLAGSPTQVDPPPQLPALGQPVLPRQAAPPRQPAPPPQPAPSRRPAPVRAPEANPASAAGPAPEPDPRPGSGPQAERVIPDTLSGRHPDELTAPMPPLAAGPETTPSAWSTREPKTARKPSRIWPTQGPASTPSPSDSGSRAWRRPTAPAGGDDPASRLVAGVTLHGAPAGAGPEGLADAPQPLRPVRPSAQRRRFGRFRRATVNPAAVAQPVAPRTPAAHTTLSSYSLSGVGGGRVSPRAKLLFSVAGVLLVLLIVLILAGGSAKTASRRAAHHTPAPVATTTATTARTATVSTIPSVIPPPAALTKRKSSAKTRTAKHLTPAQKRAAVRRTAERRTAAAKTAEKRAAARKTAEKRAAARKAALRRAAAGKAAAKHAAAKKK
jgi:hypothetical protein